MEGLIGQILSFGFGLLLVVVSAYAGAFFGYRKTAKLEEDSFRNKLRMAALDKRLDKDQEAYALWYRLFHSLHREEEASDRITECQDWWVNNCLYLSEESRYAFASAITDAGIYLDIKRSIPKSGPTDSRDMKALKKLWKEIGSCGPILVKSVGLPPINDKELNKIDRINRFQTPSSSSSGSQDPTP